MCLAIPGKVIEIADKEAIVEYPGQTRRAMIGGTKVKIDDYVMVQMGIIIKVLSKEDYDASQLAWNTRD